MFRSRVNAQYTRLCHRTAEHAAHLCRKERFAAIFLVGAHRLIKPIADALQPDFRRKAILIDRDFGEADMPTVRTYLEPEITRCESRRELAIVSNLLRSEHGVVIGIDETLGQLQNKRVRKLVVSADLDARLHRCRNCGWIDSSADPVCSVCLSGRFGVNLRDILPELAAASETEIEAVSGDAAMRLNQGGGIAGWLGQATRRARPQAAGRKPG